MHYGNMLGIETAIEIDMPGHTSSIWFSHPELITAFNAQPYSTYCAEPPCGSLKLNDSAVYSFLDTMFDDLFPRISEYSAYFHSGGDEVNFNAYLLDDTVKSNDTAVLQPLMQTFIDHVHGKIRAAGLTPIVWEEMLLTYNLTMGSDVMVNCWLSDESVAQTVAKGHRAIVGNYNNWVSPFWLCWWAPCTDLCYSTLIVAKGNGSIFIPTSRHNIILTTIIALHARTGVWYMLWILSPAFRRTRRISLLAVKYIYGLNRSTRSILISRLGHELLQRRKYCGAVQRIQ